MVRVIRRGSRGFTFLELIIVLIIIGLLVSMGITTYLTTIPRIRLRNDARALNGVIQLARLRAISTGIPHGVAFQRQAGNLPDRYFVFMDCAAAVGDAHPDLKFTDTDLIPDNNTPITTGGGCDASTLTYDPRIKDLGVQALTRDVRFGSILGSNAAPAPDNSKLEYFTFNSVGQAMQGHNLAVAINGKANEIIIERTLEGDAYQTGATLIPGTGLSYTFSMRKKL
jgi:prepilin-type N-terminal cleavage/methylation domain-containing protein